MTTRTLSSSETQVSTFQATVLSVRPEDASRGNLAATACQRTCVSLGSVTFHKNRLCRKWFVTWWNFQLAREITVTVEPLHKPTTERILMSRTATVTLL